MNNNRCDYCGREVLEPHKESMPHGEELEFCCAECARNKYREELVVHGD